MSSKAVRSGDPIEPTTSTAGTDNSQTAPRIVTFSEPVRPCLVTNHCTNAIIVVKVNETSSNDFDNDADDDGLGHVIVAIGGTADVSFGGRISVLTVSFATKHGSDDLDDVSVIGWRAR